MNEGIAAEVLRMSLSGSVLILAVAVIRSLTLHRLPKGTFLALWGVALCRLLLPFSIPSPLNIHRAGSLAAARLATSGVPSPAAGGGAGIAGAAAAAVGPSAVQEAAGVPLSALLWAVWLIGLLACAGYFVFTHLRCRREYRTALPAEEAFIESWLGENPLRRRIRIMRSDRVSAPLTYGLLRPVILLPKAAGPEDETRLRIILAHELSHIRRFDVLKKLLLAAALCVHWFNPLVWAMYVLANRDIELCCDESAVRSLGEGMKAGYALTLIGLAEERSRQNLLASHFGRNAVEERIVAVMKMKKPTLIGILVALVLVAGTVTVFATSADAKPGDGEFRLSYQGETIGLGDSSPAFLGEPAKTQESADNVVAPGDTWRKDFFDGLLIEYYVSGGTERAAFIEVTSPDGVTSRGIRVGSTKAEVLAAYPEIDAGDLAERAKVLWYDEDYNSPQSDRIFFYFDDADRVSSVALERQSITNSDWVSTNFPEFTDELLRELRNGHRTGLFDAENVRNEFLDTVKPYGRIEPVSQKDGKRIYRAELIDHPDYGAIEIMLEQVEVTAGSDEPEVWSVVAYRYVDPKPAQ